MKKGERKQCDRKRGHRKSNFKKRFLELLEFAFFGLPCPPPLPFPSFILSPFFPLSLSLSLRCMLEGFASQLYSFKLTTIPLHIYKSVWGTKQTSKFKRHNLSPRIYQVKKWTLNGVTEKMYVIWIGLVLSVILNIWNWSIQRGLCILHAPPHLHMYMKSM